VTKTRRIFKWADRGKQWTSKQTKSANNILSLLFVQPTLCFCVVVFCRANSRATKVGQVFPHATCYNQSFVVLFVDDPLWSWCYSLEEFSCRGWCVVLSAADKVFGWRSEWTNIPHATLCVWLNEMMTKPFWRHYDINNLTQDYRKQKEESKETMALEVVTDGKNDKTEKND